MECKYCGEEFTPKSYQQKFCCIKHKDAYWNKKKPDRHKDKNYYRKYNMTRYPYDGNRFHYQGDVVYSEDGRKFIWNDECDSYLHELDYLYAESIHPFSEEAFHE